MVDLIERLRAAMGPTPGLDAAVHALRGVPIVINVWASWC
jgi:hypothetical protein